MTTTSQCTGESLAWLGLALVDGLTPGRARTLARRLGGPEAVLKASAATLVAAGVEAAVVTAIRSAPARTERELARIEAAGARLVALGARDYPTRLMQLADPPLVLAVRGWLACSEGLAVAVVGARRASAYGRRVAEELAVGLAGAGVTVVSGLAAGIDAAAHRGALAAGGETIAVMGTGIDLVYPPAHAPLAGEIAVHGALVSEFPCGAPPLAFHFPRRNRLISGFAAGVVVVEAAERSGSLITVGCALEQGREVFAVPGPVGVAGHRGPHRLIQQGAKLVTTAEDILEELAPALVSRVATARARAAEASLTAVERQVLDALGREGGHVDEVIRRAALSAPATLETLLALELRGVVRQAPGKHFQRCAA